MKSNHLQIIAIVLLFGIAGAVGPGVINRVSLHIKAKQFFEIPNSMRSTRPSPDTVFVVIQQRDDDVLCFVGPVRIALLGRTHDGGFGLNVPIAGDTPEKMIQKSVKGIEYFSHSYADGQTKCVVLGFPFLYRDGKIHIGDQTLDAKTPAVVIVDSKDQVLHTYFP